MIKLRIKEMRTERNWTQADLEELSGIATPVISRLETGAARFNSEHLDALCKAFGAPPSALFYELDPAPGPRAEGPAPMRLRLRELRKAHYMTQDQLSERTGLLTSVISELENGRARYNQTHIELLCAAFDVPVCELIEPGNAPECSAEAPTCRCSLSLRDESQLKSLIETAVRDAMSDGEWRLKKV